MKVQAYKGQNLVHETDLGPEVEHLGDGKVSFFVGRAEDCHIVLNDMKVSREHVELECNAGVWTARKAAPGADIQLNGKAVQEAVLSDGDVLGVAQFILKVELPPSMGTSAPMAQPAPVIRAAPVPVETQARTETEIEEIPAQSPPPPAEPPPPEEHDLAPLDGDATGPLDAPAAVPAPEALSEDAFPLEEVGGGDALQEMGALVPMDGGPEESGGGDDGSTKVFRSFAKFELELFGESAPYDKFVVEAAETFIGRDPAKCQIVLKDAEVSSVHAVIRKNNITCTIEDLKSSNGTLLNGARINRTELTNNDEFIIGGTTFTVHIYSDLNRTEEDRLMPVEQQQVVVVEEIVEVEGDFGEESGGELGGAIGDGAIQEKSLIKRIMKDPVKRKKAIYALVGLVAAYVFLVPDEPAAPPAPTAKETAAKEGEAPAAAGTPDAKGQIVGEVKKESRPLSKEQEQYVESSYQLARELHDVGKYGEALLELDRIFALTPNYKEATSLKESAKEGLAKLEELERKRREELERKLLMQKVKELVERAKTATKERNAEVADALFGQVLALDPENFDVPQLKIELEAWKKEQERIALEKAQKEGDRKRKVSQFQPAKNIYLQKDWFKAVMKLEEFLKIPDMDEDLTQEATGMLQEAKKGLNEQVSPLMGKARSLKEGQDLKGAYENYMRVLLFDPINQEAQEETMAIRELLNIRAKRIYREAIIAESLSLFTDAKEKFQEVQQVSPNDSDYYKKASDKLKEYTE